MGKKRQRQSRGEVDGSEATGGASFDHWIADLAKQSAEPSAKSQLSKLERVERRAEKKRRRQDRKTDQTIAADEVEAAPPSSKKKSRGNTTVPTDFKRLGTSQQNRARINAAAKALVAAKKKSQNDDKSSKRYPRPFQGYQVTKKRNARGSRRWDEEAIQPRTRDYGGIGLAQPSLFLSFEDPSFVRRLQDEFQEHIEGFFGKQRTKAMKKQLDGNMLWRKMSNIKGGNQKVDGKKLAKMSPDERVEAMLKAGLL